MDKEEGHWVLCVCLQQTHLLINNKLINFLSLYQGITIILQHTHTT